MTRFGENSPCQNVVYSFRNVAADDYVYSNEVWNWYEEWLASDSTHKMRCDILHNGGHYSALILVCWKPSQSRQQQFCLHVDPKKLHAGMLRAISFPFNISEVPTREQADNCSDGYLALAAVKKVKSYVDEHDTPRNIFDITEVGGQLRKLDEKDFLEAVDIYIQNCMRHLQIPMN